MSVSRARAVAFDVLFRVEAEGAYATDLLHAELAPSLGAKDAALATEIVLGVLRWRRLLDFLLVRHIKKPRISAPVNATSEPAIENLDLPVAIALRMGTYQLQMLERIPARAAVNESVELVKRARKSSAASLVNAVLRRIADEATRSDPSGSARPQETAVATTNASEPHRENRKSRPHGERPFSDGAAREIETPPLQPETKHPLSPFERLLAPNLPRTERLAMLHSHPTWLVERWLARFGEQRTLALLDANNSPPRLSCALHDLEHREAVLDELAKAGLRVEPGILLKKAFAVSGGSVTAIAPFRRGAISIQDEASQAIPLLLAVKPGDRVLDLCAAPGGKTMRLARDAGPAGFVVAADRHAHRLRAMRKQFERLQLTRVHSIELDAQRPLPFSARFNRVLVDAPCSGTGTLARHPEIRWRLKPEQLAEFHGLQVAILKSAIDVLAPGGRLVYSTCSLEPEENEDVIADVLRNAPHLRAARADEVAPLLAPHLADGVHPHSLFDASGYFRTFPGAQPTDGFFAAVVEKNE